MGHNRRRRPTGGRRATFAAVALILGGGGLMAANVYASATEGGSGSDGKPWTTGAVTIDCPDVGSELTTVPDDARAEVDKELAQLDQQTAAAYQQLQDNAQAVRQDDSFADNAVMKPLKEKRAATIERIAVAVDRTGDRPQGLDDLAECTLRTDEPQNGDNGQNGDNARAVRTVKATRTAATSRTATAARPATATRTATAVRPATAPCPPTTWTSPPSSPRSNPRTRPQAPPAAPSPPAAV